MNLSDDTPIWRKPDYKGNLKPTPWLPCQPGYVAPIFTDEEYIEFFYELYADRVISEDLLNACVAKVCAGKWKPADQPQIEEIIQMKSVGRELEKLLQQL